METEKQDLRFFRYNDFIFIPVRKFSVGEKEFVGSVLSDKKNEKLLSKNSLFYAGYLESKKPEKSPAIKEPNGHYAVYKDGIKTVIGTDKKGHYVVTGFDYNDTNQEAEDSIATGIARYGYTPEFLGIYAQVGVSLASLGINIPQDSGKSTVHNNVKDKRLSGYEKILYQRAKVNVNGVVRECKNGLVQGFKNAVSKIDKLGKENIELKNENQNLRRIIQNNLETEIER